MNKKIKAQVNTVVDTTTAVESKALQGLTKKRGEETIESLEAQLGVKVYFKEHIDKKGDEDKYHVVVESHLGFCKECRFREIGKIASSLITLGHKLDNKRFNRLFEMKTDLLKEYIKGNFHTGIGWHEYQGQQLFLYREAASRNRQKASEYRGNLEIQVAGALDTYIEEIKKQVVPYTKLMIVYLAGASGIINQQLGMSDSTIMVNLCGESGSGKTTAENLALSFWGNPMELGTTFNSTINRTEQVLAERFIMPVVVDDVLAGNNFSTDRTKQKVISNQIFRYSTGKLKGRLNQYENKYFGAALVSSETSLFQKMVGSETDGQFYRMIELHVKKGELTRDAAHAKKLDRLVRWNYGLGAFELGKFMVEHDYVGTRLQMLYNEQHESLCGDDRLIEHHRVANRLAIITMTAKLMNECFKLEIDIDALRNVLIESVLMAVEIPDMKAKAYYDLHKLILNNTTFFADKQESYDKQKHIGVYKVNEYGQHELIVETERISPLLRGVELEQILVGFGDKKVKQPPTKETQNILRNWCDRGWLICSTRTHQLYKKLNMGVEKQVLVYNVVFHSEAGADKATAMKGGEV